MKLAMIGLGKMGGNMTTRLLRSGIEVVGYDRSVEVVAKLVETEGMIASSSVADAVSKLGENGEKRIVWLMLPSGEPTEIQIQNLAEILAKGDIIIDGGNSLYTDTERRDQWLGDLGFRFIGAGVSGGEEGARKGPAIMPGGPASTWDVMRPIF